MERRLICGRDAAVYINGRKLLQAEKAELRRTAELHRVRSCFCSGDVAHIEGRSEYKLSLISVSFLRPFENCNYYDLDNFSVRVVFGDDAFALEGCMWDDFLAAADREQFREHISISALTMTHETTEGAEE